MREVRIDWSFCRILMFTFTMEFHFLLYVVDRYILNAVFFVETSNTVLLEAKLCILSEMVL